MLAAITAGLFFGGIYNYHLRLPENIAYHKLVAGWGFILCMFIFRTASAILAGTVVSNPAGWIGIGILWATFCLFIWIGRKLASIINSISLKIKEVRYG
jgi:hypothetical protein